MSSCDPCECKEDFLEPDLWGGGPGTSGFGCCKCCACCWKWHARLIWFLIITVIFTSIYLLLFFCGYKARNKWNEGAIETECKILDFIARPGTASYTESCRCRQVCGTSCSTVCETCSLPYYNGLLNITYLELYNVVIVVIENKYKDANSMLDELRSKYQINSTIPCYYQRDDPTNLKLHLDDVIVWLICSFIPVLFIVVLWITWATLDIIRCRRKFCTYCKGNKQKQEMPVELDKNSVV